MTADTSSHDQLQAIEPENAPAVADPRKGLRPVTVNEHRLAAAGGDPEKAQRTQLIIDGRARICGAIVHDRVLPPNEHVARANRKQRRHLAKQRRAGVL